MIESVELYRLCVSEDSAEKTQGYESLWPYLYRIAQIVVRDQHNADSLAQDCAQQALIRIHSRITECKEPAAFRTWSRRIVSHVAIDELRKRKRLSFTIDADDSTLQLEAPESEQPETVAADNTPMGDLRALFEESPMSKRSRRVVAGRYFEEQPDEVLAQRESELSGKDVRPSHVQVTRAKNIAKLKNWEPMRQFLGSFRRINWNYDLRMTIYDSQATRNTERFPNPMRP